MGFSCLAATGASTDPLSIAADFYYSKHDFRKAYELEIKLLERQPGNASVVARLADLKVMFEGRGASRELLLGFLSRDRGGPLSLETRLLLREKLKALATTFVTDEGQSLYFRARARIQRKEYALALPLLDRAFSLEAGNLRILLAKGECEKRLGRIEPFYAAAKEAFGADPFDARAIDLLLQGHIYFKQFASVISLFRKNPDLFSSVSQKTAVAVSLAETGETQEALERLRGLIGSKRVSLIHPILFLAAGRLLAAHRDTGSEAISYLERFLSLSQSAQNCARDGWDPYHCSEYVDEAKRLMASLKR